MASRGTTVSKMDKERDKAVQDKLQILLVRMLQDEDNKYCVDCDSKGPRWASWNLGLFLCIRCAGIHRNLGVHISKVRSVNLDSWTLQQVASMQLMGNSKARAVYEANIPDDFKRPQSDSQLEQFIRAKYERKKYMAKDFVPPKVPDYPQGWNELVEAERQKKDPRTVALPPPSTGTISLPKPPQAANVSPAAQPKASTNMTIKEAPKAATPQAAPASLADDLFGLSLSSTVPPSSTSSQPATPSSFSNDLLGLGVPSTNNVSNNISPSGDFDFFGLTSSSSNSSLSTTIINNNNVTATKNQTNNLFSSDLTAAFGEPQQNGGSSTTGNSFSADFAATTVDQQDSSSKMSKDSILALFNKPGSGHQPFAPQQQQQQQQQQQMMFPPAQQPMMTNQFLPNFAMPETNHNSTSPMFPGLGFPQTGLNQSGFRPSGMSNMMPTPTAANLGMNNFGAVNNPFMTLSSVISTTSTPNFDSTRNPPTVGGINNGPLNFFQ